MNELRMHRRSLIKPVFIKGNYTGTPRTAVSKTENTDEEVKGFAEMSY